MNKRMVVVVIEVLENQALATSTDEEMKVMNDFSFE